MSRMSDALVAHWLLNDNAASTTVVEQTGTHAGTYTDNGGAINTSTGSTAGLNRLALALDGTDEYIDCGNDGGLNFIDTSFSLCIWIYIAAWDGYVMSRGEKMAGGYQFYAAAGGSQALFGRTDQGEPDFDVSLGALSQLPTSEWCMVTMVRVNGDVIKLYCNATELSYIYQADPAVDAASSAESFMIGADHAGANFLGASSISNAMIFNVDLTVAEIEKLYNNGHGTAIVADLDEANTRARVSNTSAFSRRARY